MNYLPRWYPKLVALGELARSDHHPGSYAGGSLTTGRVTQAGQVLVGIYRTDRPYGSGGGLAFLVRDVNYKKITSPSRDSDLEMQGISITWKRRVINIFNLYHPPNQGHLPAEIFDCSDKNTIFLGDLNAKHQRWGCSTNNDRGNDLLNVADDRALIFLNSGIPTHTSFSYGTSEALDITLVSTELHPH
ncbi:hypothetical protein TNCV_1512121 [Trichonephila clavipes]|nr:hypothetical protein TNCV_1512121 [Trichonephila clavipes]